MNRRDAALLAHLDAIEGRLSARFDAIEARISAGFDRVNERLDKIHEDIAGIKVDLATHRHEDD